MKYPFLTSHPRSHAVTAPPLSNSAPLLPEHRLQLLLRRRRRAHLLLEVVELHEQLREDLLLAAADGGRAAARRALGGAHAVEHLARVLVERVGVAEHPRVDRDHEVAPVLRRQLVRVRAADEGAWRRGEWA